MKEEDLKNLTNTMYLLRIQAWEQCNNAEEKKDNDLAMTLSQLVLELINAEREINRLSRERK